MLIHYSKQSHLKMLAVFQMMTVAQWRIARTEFV